MAAWRRDRGLFSSPEMLPTIRGAKKEKTDMSMAGALRASHKERIALTKGGRTFYEVCSGMSETNGG
jgi:hypothetical protein